MRDRGERMPAYVDIDRLCFELCLSRDTIERCVKDGRLPAPKLGIGQSKRMWKWREIEAAIDGKAKPDPVSRDIGQEIEDAARAATTRSHR